MKTIAKVIFLFTIACVMSSCFGIKLVGGTGPSGNLYEEFYTKEGATMYFINKLKYKTQNGQINIDYTFKDFGQDTTTVTANYTLTITKPEKVESISLQTTNGNDYSCTSNNNLYIKNDRLFTSRNSSTFSFSSVSKYFNDLGNLQITSNKGTYILKPTSRTKRKAKKLNKKIFELIELKSN